MSPRASSITGRRSAVAEAAVAPARSRPIACTTVARTAAASRTASGVHNCVAVNAGSKPREVTPITVKGRRSTWTVVPTTAGSAPNMRVHKPWLKTTTAASRSKSSAAKGRPTINDAPRTEKKSADTWPAGTLSGSPPPATARSSGQMPATVSSAGPRASR